MWKKRGFEGIVYGVILGAGFGTRLRPLTLSRPKPLLPVGGKEILRWTLDELAAVGSSKVAINLHHLADQIPATMGPSFGQMELGYSQEEEILGTLGALAPMAEELQSADLVILINGDSLCRWPLDKLVNHHLASESEVTLLTTSFPDPGAYGGGIAVDEQGRVVAFRGSSNEVDLSSYSRTVFAGAHVFSPRLVQGVEPRFSDIVRDLYEPMLADGRQIHTFQSKRPWFDLGTPRRYLEGAIAWTCGRMSRLTGASWNESEPAEGSRIRRSVVEPGATVEEDCEIVRSLILPGAVLGKASVIRDSIVGFDVELPPGTQLEGRMVTPLRMGETVGPESSIVDQLVYTPMDRPGSLAH